MRKRMWFFGLMRIQYWRLIPWYERSVCDSGCCVRREFTWLFLHVGLVTTTKE